jgi:competence protein ComEC
MRLALLSFVGGVCAVQALTDLPPAWSALVLLVPALAACRRRPRVCACLAAALMGCAWALWHGALGLAARLPAALDGEAFRVEGRIAGAPRRQHGVVQFELDLIRIERGRRAVPALRRLALSDYQGGLLPAPGSRCTLHVRLRSPRGLRNPAGPDFERWLFSQRIDATGYLIAHPGNVCTAERWHGRLDRLRQRLAGEISASAGDGAAAADTAGVLRALAVGERAAMTDRQWQVLQATGTTHLVSISGLHVSMVAAVVFWLARGAWSLSPALRRRAPAPHAAAGAGLAAACAYALLAGFTVPTQRTLLMLACMLWQRRRGQRLLNADGLLVALGLVVLWDPLAVLTASFWLSFGAMGSLVLLSALLRDGGFVRRSVGIHLWLALALAPLLALLSPVIAWTSPLANLVAVPLVTWGVVPLVLIGVTLSLCGLPGAPACWRLAARVWDLGWAGLGGVAEHAPAWNLPHAPPVSAVLLSLLGLGALLLPLASARWWLSPLLCASLWLSRPAVPAAGDFSLTVLDVGQGLAVLVRTRQHALLYDAGPVTRGGRDLGASVVVPNLRAAGVGRLDALVLSHEDSDHAGGADSVLRELAVERLLLSPSSRRDARAARCMAGMRWRWDDVDFEIVHPAPGDRGSENELSCVLRVAGRARSALLTGDIEARAEAALLRRWPALAADVVVTPHHGSASSSTADFVAALRPAHAIHSAAHGNRYGFPAPAVTARYAAAGATQSITGAVGAVHIEARGAALTVAGWRAKARRYWHAR